MGHFEIGRWVDDPIHVTQIRSAIISSAKHICEIYGFGCEVDDSYLHTDTVAQVLIGVELIGNSE